MTLDADVGAVGVGVDTDELEGLIEVDVIAVATDADEYEESDGGEGDATDEFDEDMVSNELLCCFWASFLFMLMGGGRDEERPFGPFEGGLFGV